MNVSVQTTKGNVAFHLLVVAVEEKGGLVSSFPLPLKAQQTPLNFFGLASLGFGAFGPAPPGSPLTNEENT
jgi:hypothetical protein